MVKNKRLYLIPIKGFFSLILIGTVLLLLPVCNNKNISIIDSLFTATSSICVTGVSTVTISDQFSLLGQIIIAILMQIGALGFMVFIQYIYIIKHENKGKNNKNFKIYIHNRTNRGNNIINKIYTKIRNNRGNMVWNISFNFCFLQCRFRFIFRK